MDNFLMNKFQTGMHFKILMETRMIFTDYLRKTPAMSLKLKN